jgi:hypothetical protein
MLSSKQYNKIDLLHQIVGPQLSSGKQHNNSTKTRFVGCINKQSYVYAMIFTSILTLTKS